MPTVALVFSLSMLAVSDVPGPPADVPAPAPDVVKVMDLTTPPLVSEAEDAYVPPLEVRPDSSGGCAAARAAAPMWLPWLALASLALRSRRERKTDSHGSANKLAATTL